MDNKRLDDIHSKLDKLDSRLDNIDKTLVAQQKDLEHHVKRTDLAEKRIEQVERNNSKGIEDIQKRLAPFEKVKLQIEGALKLIGIICVCIGGLVGVVEGVRFLLSLF